MNILVIGNGFDIAHGIPSSYKNFLDFVIAYKKVYKYYASLNTIEKNNFSNGITRISSIYKDTSFIMNEMTLSNSHASEFGEMINHNCWIEYFLGRTSQLERKHNWVDIEEEISRVIKTLTQLHKTNKGINFSAEEMHKIDCVLNSEVHGRTDGFDREDEVLLTFMNRLMEEQPGQQITNQERREYWQKFTSILSADFSKLVRSLELYLDYFIDFTKLSKSDIFDGIKFDHLVTFNYTNTYRVLYNSIISGDFIHGRAQACRDKEESDVVLGIEEFLDEDQKNKDVEFIAYRKYYQRIIKHCDFSYRKVLENSNNAISTWFFGHSLASSDKDILTHLLPSSDLASQNSSHSKSNVKKSYICYYSQHTLEQQVANLVQVLGQEALNDLVCGPDPKIKFVFQDNFKKERMISMNEERTY